MSITVQTNNQKTNKINCKINIIWFNLLFSKTVFTKIGHYFVNLLANHFPKKNITNHKKTIQNKSETFKKNATVLTKPHAH